MHAEEQGLVSRRRCDPCPPRLRQGLRLPDRRACGSEGDSERGRTQDAPVSGRWPCLASPRGLLCPGAKGENSPATPSCRRRL